MVRSLELRRILENAATLLGGHAGAAVLQLAALALTARALGPEKYGALVLIQTWVLVVDRLLSFQSWQVVIRYGAVALEEQQPRAFRSVVKLAFGLDVLAAIASALVAAGAIAIGARVFGWDPLTKQIGIAYSAVLLFHLAGMPTGVLRLLDRFAWFAGQSVLSAAFRLALVAWAYFGAADLVTFAFVWAVADIAGNVLLFVLGRIALGRAGHGLLDGSIAEARARHPDIFRFALLTNLETTFRHVFRDADVFLVRAFLDTGAVGLYYLIKQVASVPERVTNPLYYSVMPVMARLWAKQEIGSIWEHIKKTRTVGVVVAAALVVGYLAVGRFAIDVALGGQYAAIYLPAAIALAGTSIWAVSYAYSALLVAMGLAREKLRLTIIASVSAMLLQVALLPSFGLMGAAIGFAVASIMWIGTAAIIVHGKLK